MTDSTTSKPALCLGCHKNEIEYQSPLCRHPSLCKKCAMVKQATGGKCKVCGELFSELQRVDRDGSDESDVGRT
ncbi:hypothetical protein M427DRAFT_55666 [Gonapodya prolifera JEL478]|uniref:RING-type domain-containing protein n=1 Tax=Gonapodya prolifera (strain JEL478) TaxID=1344416 RepID=A0A139AIJ9_GONPJ|nr:hypothetical protein M427DRAFT_55666 [Gonapodya prolifera JEL478]|eukprot:KXS16235.1 hypothetical protein M427DRAFT_55666 [Gonapodya prolifera JEL478]